jgi:hypothetical protein
MTKPEVRVAPFVSPNLKMALSIKQIRNTRSDEELLDLFLEELRQLFPPELRDDPSVFYSRLHAAPAGIRAMAVTYELDVSMALDDLAWHFINYHSSIELAEETIAGLNELETPEAAEIFQEALHIIKPHWQELEQVSQSKEPYDWLDSKGIQDLMNPLNDRMWKLLKQYDKSSLMALWVTYARKYPERCSTPAK